MKATKLRVGELLTFFSGFGMVDICKEDQLSGSNVDEEADNVQLVLKDIVLSSKIFGSSRHLHLYALSYITMSIQSLRRYNFLTRKMRLNSMSGERCTS